ncbi:bacterial Ig-like domain-containing protein [Paenibacillus sp. CGMCC 1.16610]|uniref:Exopolygalacturonate lyase n=1 Tax=Paenibacillus anseongense TaxID=2682845 RepID=A0ABW9UEQ3_9BACL|nr:MULTISPECIES: bacterial Ig-like domain-containing protein [Paenibacillus]MBA2940203.1 bacterial Ig-like domain-containing protein [Paenibacillus sp. CGMCC 1.16610]MVQ38657.1 exopolygalacturonate lyase [Paenibacillus anseongense]
MNKRRMISVFMSVVLMFSMLPVALAADAIPWEFSAFGAGTSSINTPVPTMNADGSVTMLAKDGKLASAEEGISYYFKKLEKDANLEIRATATVVNFNSKNPPSTPNQKSFGLMLRGSFAQGNAKQSSNYIAVGGMGDKDNTPNVVQAIYKQGVNGTTSDAANTNKKLLFSGVRAPAPKEVYNFKIKKSGDAFELTVNGVTQILTVDHLFDGNDQLYAGLYVARDAEITFSNFDIKVDERAPKQLKLNTTSMKKDYFIKDNLDLTGLKVTAVYADNHEEELSVGDYLVTGFDNSVVGTNLIKIHFNGQTATIPLNMKDLVMTAMDIQYKPAKTDYYPEEFFDPQGLTVLGQFNGGDVWAEMADSQYAISLPPAAATVSNATYTLKTPGIHTVTVRSTVTTTTYATFDVTVKNAHLTGLDIKQLPQKTQFFVGKTFDPAGLVVEAKYSDASTVRLLRSDYTLSAPDMSTAGTKDITVTYKNVPDPDKTVKFPILVKQQTIIGSQVTGYPQTTYAIGESFDPAGLEVKAVYDSGDQEPLADAQLTLDTSAFDSTKAGVYPITITPVNAAIPPTVLQVSVVEPREQEWKVIRFGQSTSNTNNTVTVVEPGKSATLVALEGGGKVTGDHDGISFYYTELDAVKDNFELSADIKVVAYAKDPHDGQESFGIMARDAIGTAGDSAVFASNIAAVGGYSGGTTKQNGTQLFVRTGVTAPNGTGSQGVQSKMLSAVKPALANTYPAANYKLTLTKTNSGFTGRLNSDKAEEIFAPNIMTVQDGDKMYVGFFTARLATIEVSGIDLKVTAAQTDAPKKEPAPAAIDPDMSLTGLTRTSTTAYSFGLKSNVSGVVTIKQGSSLLTQNAQIQAGQPLVLNTTVTANTYTNFSAAFVPDDTQYLTNYGKIVKNFTVDMKTYVDNGDIYVSPTGTAGGDGTINNPLDLDTAIDYVKSGQTIILLDGRYVRSAKLEIKKGNDGTVDAMKSLIAAPGAKPVIDFDKKTEGVVLSGNYWHVKGIDFTRSAGNTKGFTVGGNHNIVELSRFYDNGDTGLQISRTDESDSDKTLWPSYNLILNCESFDNVDPSNNNADGFAAKLTSGVGNVFRGDISHNNIDDGWDLYTKSGTGAIGPVVIEDSIAYHNGTLTNGTVGAGDKNGFKLGGEGIHVPHVIRNSIAFGNGAYGFASNSNPGVRAENGNIAFNNTKGNLNFTTYTGIQTDFRIDGFTSYQKDYTAKDNYPAALSSDTNYLFDGSKSMNKSGTQLTDANFASLVPALPYQRDAVGNIIRGNFLKLVSPSAPSRSDSGGGSFPGSASPSITVKEVTGGVELIGVPAVATIDGKKVSTFSIAADQLNKAIDLLKKANGNTIIAEVKGDGTVAAVELPASSISAVAAAMPNLELSIRSGGMTYNLPLKALDVEALAASLGTDAANVKIHISLEQVTGAAADPITAKMKEDGVTPLTAPVEFSIVAEGNGKKVVVSDFGGTYVTRVLTLSSAVDADRVSAVWLNPATGELTFVPAIFNVVNGQTEVTMKRTGNSVYAVVSSDQTFGDLIGHWAQADVELLASKLAVKGVAAGTFAPNASITRAEFAALLVRALGLNEAGASAFSDVPANSWFAGAVGASAKAGLIEGFEDGSFGPGEQITREQMAVMITRAMKFAGQQPVVMDLAQLAQFGDSPAIHEWAKAAVAEAVRVGIVNGVTDTTFAPGASATRGEAAVMLKRLLQKLQFMN